MTIFFYDLINKLFMLFLFDKIKHTQHYVQKYKKIIDYRQINNTCQHTLIIIRHK